MGRRWWRHGGVGARAGMWAAAVGVAGVVIVVPLWAGCEVTEENYALLSTIFDGVPDPRVHPAVAGLAPGDPRRTPTYTIHKPYEEENCQACHKSRLKPSRNDASSCKECHAGVQTEHRWMHGPVAAGACLWCHSPHESPFAHLMRDTDRKVCMQCHTERLLSAERVPAHADASRGCLECHTGHGSEGRYMLKPEERPAPGGSGAAPAQGPRSAESRVEEQRSK